MNEQKKESLLETHAHEEEIINSQWYHNGWVRWPQNKDSEEDSPKMKERKPGSKEARSA